MFGFFKRSKKTQLREFPAAAFQWDESAGVLRLRAASQRSAQDDSGLGAIEVGGKLQIPHSVRNDKMDSA